MAVQGAFRDDVLKQLSGRVPVLFSAAPRLQGRRGMLVQSGGAVFEVIDPLAALHSMSGHPAKRERMK